MSTTAAAGPDRLLSDVLATYENAPDARLRGIMEAAVRHLHTFVREVGLTTMRAAHVHLIASAPGVEPDDDGVPAATFDIVLTPDTPR